MKDGKASGADSLCGELFKNLDEVKLYALTKLFNSLPTIGHFPASWAHGLIIPIHKGGDPDCVNIYRGITLQAYLLLQRYSLMSWKTDFRHGLLQKE